MEEQRLIQVSVQLPISELGRLSTLLERFQQVLASSGQSEPALSLAETALPAERGENTAFDPVRFSALNQAAATEEKPSGLFTDMAVPQVAQTEYSEVSFPQTLSKPAEPPSPSTASEIERQLPEAAGAQASAAQEAAWEGGQDWEAVPGEVPDPPVFQTGGGGGEAPLSAGLTVEGSTGTPDTSKRTVLEERLTATGPAPLTAEAVSLAFQRDDRRYDNGFPLY